MSETSKTEIFKTTIPVLMGYVPLGIAFGIYGINAGLSAGVLALTSIFVYAGSVEFVLVAFIVSKASLAETFFVAFLLNFRHFFYTMSLLDEIRALKRRVYFIYALTDETFALLKSRDFSQNRQNLDLIFNLTAALNHSYWVFGVILGALLGASLDVDFSGVEFSLAALFAMLTYEVFKVNPNERILFLAFGCAFVGLFVFPTQYFLFGALMSGILISLAFKKFFIVRGQK